MMQKQLSKDGENTLAPVRVSRHIHVAYPVLPVALRILLFSMTTSLVCGLLCRLVSSKVGLIGAVAGFLIGMIFSLAAIIAYLKEAHQGPS